MLEGAYAGRRGGEEVRMVSRAFGKVRMLSGTLGVLPERQGHSQGRTGCKLSRGSPGLGGSATPAKVKAGATINWKNVLCTIKIRHRLCWEHWKIDELYKLWVKKCRFLTLCLFHGTTFNMMFQLEILK